LRDAEFGGVLRYSGAISKEIALFVKQLAGYSHQRGKRRNKTMRMMIRFQNGVRGEAVLLAANAQQMRVAFHARGDVKQLNRDSAGCWHNESGEPLEIEALIPLAGTDVENFCAELYPRALAAAAQF
jgi:hypothetical protein